MKEMLKKHYPLLILLFTYLIIRYPLYDLHKMKTWSLILFIFSLIIELVFFLKKKIYLSYMVSIGYGLGFLLGYLFNFDYGRELNSFWIIWMLSLILFIISAEVVEVIKKK